MQLIYDIIINDIVWLIVGCLICMNILFCNFKVFSKSKLNDSDKIELLYDILKKRKVKRHQLPYLKEGINTSKNEQ